MAALIRIFGIAIPLLAGAASACAFAAERASVVPPIGERASYLWTTSLRTPAGTHDSSAAVVLRGAPRGTMQIAVTVDGDDLDFLAKTLADGSLDFVATKHEDAVPELGRLDQISRLVAGAGVPPKAGDSWKLTLSEPVPGGTIEVPVVVRVVAGDDNTLNLEAEGDGRGSIELPKPPLDPAGRRHAGLPRWRRWRRRAGGHHGLDRRWLRAVESDHDGREVAPAPERALRRRFLGRGARRTGRLARKRSEGVDRDRLGAYEIVSGL